MCFQLIERHSACHCLYYQHAIDRCGFYGQPGHSIKIRTILVGYACQRHDEASNNSDSTRQADPQPISQPQFSLNILNNYATPVSFNPDLKNDTNSDDGLSESSDAIDDSDDALARAFLFDDGLGESSVANDNSDKGLALAKAFLFDDELSESSVANDDSDEELALAKEFLFDEDDRSSVTSASSVESITALQHLTNSFLYDAYLHDLWPQIFLREESVTEAKEKIALLILRYSLDLQSLARRRGISEDSISSEIRASQFVKRKRRYLTREIYKRFWEPLLVKSLPAVEGGVIEKVVDDDSDVDDDQQPDTDRFFNLHAFLFESEPFRYFRENVRLFVQKVSSDPLHITWLDSMRISFNNYITSTHSKRMHGTTRRLYWTCVS